MPGAEANGTEKRAELTGLPGWDRLRHGGLLLDGKRLAALASRVPLPLNAWTERQLRQRALAVQDGGAEASPFVSFVLEQVCGLGLGPSAGAWTRGNHVSPSWGRRAVTGEIVKPRQLWQGGRGGRLPVFLDGGKRLGIGKSRRIVSRVLGWLRAGHEHLALVTNGRQWRLVFAGLDHDAWCEWDLELWFEEGELSLQVTALRTLLQSELWTPEAEDAEPPLLQAIRDTRKGQAELSEVLGERVREAVEILIRAHGDALSSLGETDEIREYVEYLAEDAGAPAPDADEVREMFGASPAEIYRAACRVAMRLVVILFAESRDLLPRDNPLYHESYGLHGLLERLERAAARGRNLAGSFGAWPRVLALFALVREGSHHPELPVTAYGGDLFAPGAMEADDGVSRALRVYEQACFEHEVMTDREVHNVLRLLTRTTIRIRQGKSSIRAAAPVDFSDLSSEYIGILYEGLLDYELKTAPAGDPVIFLSVGDQPALPLSRLEAMDDRALRTLFEKLKEKSRGTDDLPDEEATEADASDSGDDTADAATTDEEPLLSGLPDATPSDETPPDDVAVVPDERQRNRTRAEQWARRAVKAARLLPKPRGRDTPERRLAFESRLAAKARRLVARVVLPGEWYLVRWGGTRKGSGSFYTRPGLAVPTVQRTLRPLAYDPPAGGDGKPDMDAPLARWTPKPPERILDLTVCDPACGSGTFPLAALRFLTDALYAALQHHHRLQPDGDRVLVRLLGIRGANDNDADDSRLADELIPCRPDDDSFEPRLKAVLRRHVVERCIYAIDLDPLAVELCRLSLWIETMDRTLPFGFLDHKIKCGNALIGAWFDQFAHYPVMAWKNREGGDKNHSNGVHFEKNARTKAITAFLKDKLTPDLRNFLRGADLFSSDLLEYSATAHDSALVVLQRMHAMPVHDAAERARLYRDKLVGSPAWRALKDAMDLWCACWFWPTDEISHAPLPSTLANPPEPTRLIARRIASGMRFFHWELEFADVFRKTKSGFHALLGNPPWETLQPNSMEYFSNIDPLYRSYGKQEALRRQKAHFAEASSEHDWLDYGSRFANGSHWIKYAANPFGDPRQAEKNGGSLTIARGHLNDELHDRWRHARSLLPGFTDPAHPFARRGKSKAYTYKLFLELAHSLGRPGARIGLIVPSGLYSDYGAAGLRDLLLEHCRWEWLFGIQNHEGIFPIHRSYKFNPIVAEKGGVTRAIRTAFMRRRLDDWARAEALAIPYTRTQIHRFSPKSRTIVEIQSQSDLRTLERIYTDSVLVGNDRSVGWGIRFRQGDFNMTTDSDLFLSRPQGEEMGYRPDEYGRWLRGNWRPIDELWTEYSFERSAEPEKGDVEERLFDMTADLRLREADNKFIHGNLLKHGDVTRTNWRRRCAKSPYDRLMVARERIPAGVILSRDGEAWIQEDRIDDTALPLHQGIMIQAFVPNARGWIRGTGLRARWDYSTPESLRWNPQYLMKQELAIDNRSVPLHTRIGCHTIARTTDGRSMTGSVCPPFPCGHSVLTLYVGNNAIQEVSEALCYVNSIAFDYVIRSRVGGMNLSWYAIEECPLPYRKDCMRLWKLVKSLNLFSPLFAPYLLSDEVRVRFALLPAERVRLQAMVDAVAFAAYGCGLDEIRHILRDCDRPRRSRGDLGVDPRGFWRIDRNRDPELRHTVLALVAFHDLAEKIDKADGDRERGIEAFLGQNHGEGWMLPEALRLADYGLGHDERAHEPQPVASRLGPRFYDWQLVQSADESWRECHLHARNLLGERGYALRVVDLIAQRMADEEDYRGLLTDPFTHDLAGDDGYVTVLTEVRARDLLYESAWWSLVGELRGTGHLDEDSFGRLLDQLRTRELLSDADYRRRGGSALPPQRVAETEPGGQPELFPTRRQRKLFE